MASGHGYRANRPNTWLLRPTLQSEDSSCQPGAVHTWPIATNLTPRDEVRFQGQSPPLVTLKRTFRSASAEFNLRHEPNPGREIPSRSEGSWLSNAGDQCCGQRRTDARDRIQPLAGRV